MESSGIQRCLDSMGRVVIPIEIRKRFGINIGDPIDFYIDENMIILKKYSNSCEFCGSQDNLSKFKDKFICMSCLEALRNASSDNT